MYGMQDERKPQDAPKVALTHQERMRREEAKKAIAADKDPTLAQINEGDLATPELRRLAAEFPQLMLPPDDPSRMSVPPEIVVRASLLLKQRDDNASRNSTAIIDESLRRREVRNSFGMILGYGDPAGTARIDLTGMRAPGTETAEEVRYGEMRARERREREWGEALAKIGGMTTDMIMALGGAMGQMGTSPRMQTSPSMMGVRGGQPMAPSEWNRPGSQMGTWWESLPTAAQQGINVSARAAKMEGRVPMLTEQGPTTLASNLSSSYGTKYSQTETLPFINQQIGNTPPRPITNTPPPTKSIKPNKVGIELAERKLDSDGYIRNVYSLPSGENLIWRGREENIEIPKSGVTVNVGSKPNWIPIEEGKVSDGPDTTYSASKTLLGVLQVASMVGGHKNKDILQMLGMVRQGKYNEKMYEIIDGLIALNLLDSKGQLRDSVENPSFRNEIDKHLVEQPYQTLNHEDVVLGGQDAETIAVKALNGDAKAKAVMDARRDELRRIIRMINEKQIGDYGHESSLDPEKLVAVHATSYLPELTSDGTAKIQSRSQAMDYGFPRNTVHTTLNHIVNSHSSGSWDDRDYVVLTPLQNIMSGRNKNPTALSTVDTWWSLNPGEHLEMPNAILIAPGEQKQNDMVIKKQNMYYYRPGRTAQEKTENRNAAFEMAMNDLNQRIQPGGMWSWADNTVISEKTAALASKLKSQTGPHSSFKHSAVEDVLKAQFWRNDSRFDFDQGKNKKSKWETYVNHDAGPDFFTNEGQKTVYLDTSDLLSDLPHLRNLYEHGFFTGRGTHLDVLKRQGMFDLSLDDDIDPKYHAARSKVMQMIRQNDYLQRPKPKQISMTKKPKN